MRFAVGPDQPGTPESVWARCEALARCPPFDTTAVTRAVVLAPHPDDEVLALGGTMQHLAHAGCELSIVAITDGEASHPAARHISRDQLAAIRAGERTT